MDALANEPPDASVWARALLACEPMKRTSRNPSKKKSLQRLVRTALRCWDTDKGWCAIAELQMRGSPRTLASAKRLARSASWRRRSLGLYIASQLTQRKGASSSEYAVEETHKLLLDGLHDQHLDVVRAAVSGLGHRPHPSALADLVRWSAHPHTSLRWNVAVTLGRYEDPIAIEALLKLAVDPDDAVRDWATFGLGSLQSADTPEIRAALWRNLDDQDADVRGEALVGLAVRHDERAVDHLVEHLGPQCLVYDLDAAQALAVPRLLSPLQAIAGALKDEDKEGYWFGRLQAAIEACRTESCDS